MITEPHRTPRGRRVGGFVIYAEEFLEVIGPHPENEVLVDTDAHEGPVYVAAEDALYFTTVPVATSVPLAGYREVNIKRLALSDLTMSVFRADANMANGMTLDREGRLLVCEQGTRSEPARIRRIDLTTGVAETVVDEWFGLRFNSPNDIVVKSDGTLWFTDPSYGALQGFKPEPLLGDYVYRYDPRDGALDVVADAFDKPNGIAFSPDEKMLYLTDSGAIQAPGSYHVDRPHHVRAFDLVSEGTRLAQGRLLAVVTPGIPDGLKLDSAGRVYTSSATGVKVYDPHGRLLGEILAPGVANFTFGGRDGCEVFMMVDTAIRRARIQARGAV